MEQTGHYRCRSDRHLGVADGASREAGELEGVDRTRSVGHQRQVGGYLAEHRAQRQAVTAQAGDDGQTFRSGPAVDDRQAVWREVDQARPIAGSTGPS